MGKEERTLSPKDVLRKNLNVPNALTLLRLLLVPVYIALFAAGQKYTALGVFVAASLTDMLDGFIARRYHLITDFGKLMDPFADKVMVLSAMFSLAIGNAVIPPVLPWAAVAVVLFKETIMVAGGALLLKKGIVVYSFLIGKVAHCVFIAGLVASYFHDWFKQACAGWPVLPDTALIWLAVALTLVALARYTQNALSLARKKGII